MRRANEQILTVAQMQAAEQALIDAGESVASLMETAGRGAAEWVRRIAAGRSVTVLCGPGNNGGDGYVIARVLAERGLGVEVVAPLEPKTPAAIAARAAWGGKPVANADHAILVDCLFGSGLTRPLSDQLLETLQQLAGRHSYRIAIDLPSGIDSDGGAVLNAGLPDYDLTLALGAWKFAHWAMPAMAQMGERRLVGIGVAPVRDAASLARRPRLAPPPVNAHKYSRGLLGIVGGSMPGAALLASRAAMRGGAGYVKLLVEQRPGNPPDELVVECKALGLALEDERIGALLVGPGLGRDANARERLRQALERNLPTVCDADALILLEPTMLEARAAPLVVTPHEGELAVLCGSFVIDPAPRRERVAALARALNATVVAKGPDTVIATSDGSIIYIPPAPAWLSTAGTGDVLAGLIGSRLACGSNPERAAIEGAWLHAEAAKRAGPALTAGDLVQAISAAYTALL